MLREFIVGARVGRPRVAYRESISRPVRTLDYRYVKQTGGRGQYAHIVIDVEPAEPGSGISFESEITRGTIPKEFISPVEQGIREAAESGVLGGYPVTDVKVTLVDGSYHEVDSSEMAFKNAGSMAFREALQRGASVLLEPIMATEIVIPEEHVGEVHGDLAARRAVIEGIEARPGNTQAIHAMVPLAEMFGYATELRSMTHGRGVFTMEFDHYEQVEESVRKVLKVGV
jgi:elongation factor G